MKNIVIVLTLLTSLVSCAILQGGEKPTDIIQTNAECGMCKKRIEGDLNYRKGIVFAELDIASKNLTVKYNTSKITLDEIRIIVSEIGYNADEVKANKKSQSELPACCQPGGMD